MTPKAAAAHGGGVEATARAIVEAWWSRARHTAMVSQHLGDLAAAIAAALRAAPPSGLTPPSGAAIAEYSAEAISRLASIRERLAKATSGPWVATDGRCSNVVDILSPYMGGSDEIAQVYAEDELTEQQRADGDFIAHAPDDMAWLLARLDALRESTAVAAPEGPSPVAGAPEGDG